MKELLFKLHLKEVILKNGLEGVITSVSQDSLEEPIVYLVESWTSNGKVMAWYKSEDFKLKEEEK